MVVAEATQATAVEMEEQEAAQVVEMEVETVLVQVTIQEPDLGTEQVGHLKEEAT